MRDARKGPAAPKASPRRVTKDLKVSGVVIGTNEVAGGPSACGPQDDVDEVAGDVSSPCGAP